MRKLRRTIVESKRKCRIIVTEVYDDANLTNQQSKPQIRIV